MQAPDFLTVILGFVLMSDSSFFPVLLCVSLHPSISAAEWSQTLLYRIQKEPLHLQGHKGHLPGFHREAGLFHVQLFSFCHGKSQICSSFLV